MSRREAKRIWFEGLAGCAALALWLVLSPLTAARAQDDDLSGLDDSDTEQPASDAADSGDQHDQRDQRDQQGEGEAAPEKAPAPSDNPSPAEHGPRVLIRPYAGVGITQRTFQRPGMPSGIQKLASSAVPAVEVGLDVIAWPQDAFSLAFALHYRSAIGLTVQEAPPFALANETKVRSEQIELSVAPGWQLAGPALRLAIPLGAIARTFWPNVHTLMTPGYSLIGPFARAELTVQLAERVWLRLGPEVQWITLIDKALRDTGLNSQGVALGGEASLTVELSTVWALGLAYQESHAIVNTMRGVTFEDVERYATIRVSGAF
jgi:hypothetical protein